MEGDGVDRNVIVAGTRTFEDQKAVDRVLGGYIFYDDVILSGGAKGVDTAAEDYAKRRGAKVKRFKPDWAAHGKAAGPMRNAEMAVEADMLIAIWDGKSAGTKNMIEAALRNGVETHVHFIGSF